MVEWIRRRTVDLKVRGSSPAAALMFVYQDIDLHLQHSTQVIEMGTWQELIPRNARVPQWLPC